MICEILDRRTRRTIEDNPAVSRILENVVFVTSNDIAARVLSMISQQRALAPVITELLGPEGNEVHCGSQLAVAWATVE